MTFQDRTLTCVECGNSFTFTSGEQEFHASKGFTNDPKRCPDCRAARRAGNGLGSARPERELYTTTCDSCGGEARVPFQPRGDKPVYCSDCFRSRQSAATGSRW